MRLCPKLSQMSTYVTLMVAPLLPPPPTPFAGFEMHGGVSFQAVCLTVFIQSLEQFCQTPLHRERESERAPPTVLRL